MLNSYQAKFLAAIPELSDSNFFRSVVLMFHHDEQGASGLIINRPSPVQLSDVWNEVSHVPCEISQPLYVGGPVEGPLMAIHGCANLSEFEIIEGVYLSRLRENLDEIVSQTHRPFRFFSGYSGWSSEQLEAEIQAGGWLTADATIDDVFGDTEGLWKKVCDQVGREIIFPGCPQGPGANPSLN